MPMRIGIEMRQITLGNAGGISLLLKGLLEAVFRQHPEHDYVVFTTLFNRSLLERVPPGVEMVTLPGQLYFTQLDHHAAQRDLDVLFRSYPLEQSMTFPLKKQIFLIPDIQHEFFPQFFD